MIEVTTYTLPAFWAGPLINGDYTGLNDEEVSETNAWARAEGLSSCVGVSDCAFFAKDHDARNFHGYAGDCLVFTFHTIKG
jgi:hypothetical protein